MEEPAAECAKDKSNFGRELEVGGHADEDAEHEADDRADPDCGSGTQGAHPIGPATAFPCEALLLVQSGYLTRGLRAAQRAALTRATPLSARHLPWLAVGYAEVRLLNGDVLTVQGTLDEVEGKLSDAARSGQSRLAWFTEHVSDVPVGINPAHVATLKVSEISD
jgi:hypothetical protein